MLLIAAGCTDLDKILGAVGQFLWVSRGFSGIFQPFCRCCFMLTKHVVAGPGACQVPVGIGTDAERYGDCTCRLMGTRGSTERRLNETVDRRNTTVLVG